MAKQLDGPPARNVSMMSCRFGESPSTCRSGMLILLSVIVLVAMAFPLGVRCEELRALRIRGTKLVDEKGSPVQLRGVNFGCWLLLESHFLGLSFRDEQTLWRGLEGRLGKSKTDEIKEAYRSVWITKRDFENVKSLGLNHVRVPFPATLLESDAKPGTYLDSGWKWLDNAVTWSEEAGIYCILDLHGAPGGQSKAEHTGQSDRNELWTNGQHQQRTIKLWQAVARRYKGRKSIAAFDLLNEPMGAPDAKTSLAFQLQLIRAVRAIDPTRLMIVEDGYKGPDRFQPVASPEKNNVIYSIHVYPTLTEKQPSPEHHEKYFRERFPKIRNEQARFGQPLYIGEWNVIQEAAGGAPMIRRHIEAMNQAEWSWAMWIYKQAHPKGVRGLWSLYRNTKSIDLPDFDMDDAETILKKINTGLSPDRFELYQPVAKAIQGE